jgi:16S rRNA (guanine1516-N2)-methyltransferase
MNSEDQQPRMAVLNNGQGELGLLKNLADKLNLPLVSKNKLIDKDNQTTYLAWLDGCLTLLPEGEFNKPGLTVDISHRHGEQRSWPMAKSGALAQALGRKTRTVVDATAGWGQDSLAMFRMGYEVLCIERSPIMAELLADGFGRLSKLDWMQQLNLSPPQLLTGNAIGLLEQLPFQPDCIYLDPMFPPKRKKSALAKKAIMVLRDLVGDDVDKEQLFATALKAAGKRVVVKSPEYAEPLGGKPNESFHGKLYAMMSI